MSTMVYAVLLTVYKNDRVSWIKDAVNSLLNQTIKGHIYIGVDGIVGEDIVDFLNILKQQDKVSIVWFKKNRGLACVLNDLLDICFKDSYEYIARMDADDISMPDRMEKQLLYLKTHPFVDVVGGAIFEIDENGKSRKKTIFYPETPKECKSFFAKRNPHAHPAVMFRKTFFEKLGDKKYRPEYRQNQDTMLWFDGMMAGTQHANIPDIVLKFRMTDSFFKKRRNGWAFAKKQFADRRIINKALGYGWMANLYGFAMFCMLVSPVWIKKIAYKIFR